MLKFVVLPLCLILLGAYTASAENPSPELVEKYSDVFSWFLAICIVVIGYFINRTLHSMEQNNDRQWKAIDGLNTRVSTIEGSLQFGRRKEDK